MKSRTESRRWRIVTVLALLAAASPLEVLAHGESPLEWHFDVSLDGRPIGEHRFVLRTQAGVRELTSEANFRVRVWFIDAYRYEHRAREWWRGDCLDRLDAHTDDNSKRSVVVGRRESNEFRIQTSGGDVLASECVQTFAYWNPGILEARRLLNPQTGEYQDVQVLPLGPQAVSGQAAERFRLVSRGRTPLEIDLWYSPAREWLALESRTPEGRRLRYERKGK